ncbi:MAG: molybdenum ABC transporter ATP-binding protein [Chloroflexi bacterium]|nr:molybdenum ABC transporter ATP-binding protein [Chloroflexota bacterium]
MNGLSHPQLRADIVVRRDDFHLKMAVEVASQVLVVFGPSGSGKTTLLQAIAGLVTPQTGTITLEGQTLFQREEDGPQVDLPARARRVGYVFQDYALFPHLTALGNVAYPLWRKPDAHRRSLDLLERLGLAPFVGRYPHELSGGQQQRVAIARALASSPRVLLLDEPFAALDLELRRQLRGELRRLLAETAIPVLLVTHDREEAIALGDVVQVIEEGRTIARGEPLAVLGYPPQSSVARLSGVENLYRGRVISRADQEGVMVCRVAGVDLEAPLGEQAVGQEVAIGLRSRDVLLATQQPHGLSARNVLEARVTALEAHSPGVLVEVTSGDLTVRSQVTQQAVTELGLSVDKPVWVIIKASSFFFVAP